MAVVCVFRFTFEWEDVQRGQVRGQCACIPFDARRSVPKGALYRVGGAILWVTVTQGFQYFQGLLKGQGRLQTGQFCRLLA